jgi:RND family efflux transporter MFP subunit
MWLTVTTQGELAMHRTHILWVSLAVLGGAILAIVTPVDAHENHAPLPTKGVTIAGDTIMLSDKAREAIGLTTEKVRFDELHRTVQVNAKVELPWQQQVMITSLVPGKIDAVLVRPGETVVPGQELARVKSAELESLQLAILQAQAEVQLAQKLVNQRTELGRQGIIAGKNLIEAQATLTQKSAELEISRQKFLTLGFDGKTLRQVEESGRPLPHVSITSPIGGIVTHADVRVGQVVQPTEHLYHVVDPTKVWIVGDVLESDVRHLCHGQEVEAVFAAQPDMKIAGQIDHVRLKMNQRTRTQAVVIAVDNISGKLRPGMAGHVQISVQVAEEAIVCPTDAVIESRTGHYLLVQRMPGKYENRPVKLGLEQDGKTEVVEGAFPGDQVVVVGNALLASLLGNEHKARTKDDAPVKKEPEKPSLVITVAHAAVELPTDQQSYATSRVEGRIQRVLVQPSQKVEAGQVLAEVESLSVRNVQLDLLETLSRLSVASQSLERLSKSEITGVTPERRIWQLQSEQETLRLRVETLKRQLAFFGLSDEAIAELEKVDLANRETARTLDATVAIHAPASGWIVGFNVVPGQVVYPQDTLFEIHDLSKVWIKGFVFERHAAQIELGQTARVTFAAFPNLEADGRIVRIAPTMEEHEQVLPVWVEVANPEQLLKEGMFARVTVLAKSTGQRAEGGVAQLRPITAED